MAKLNDRQMRFVDEYIIDLNATQAAIRAGYSEKTAEQTASRLLRNVKVQEYIEKRKKDRIERTEITQDAVLKELVAIAFSDITDYAKIIEKEIEIEPGKFEKIKVIDLTLTKDLTKTQKKALAVIKNGKFGMEVKTYDKVQALIKLGEHLGMFTKRVEVSGTVNNPYEGLTTEELKKLIGDE